MIKLQVLCLVRMIILRNHFVLSGNRQSLFIMDKFGKYEKKDD